MDEEIERIEIFIQKGMKFRSRFLEKPTRKQGVRKNQI